MTDVIKEIEKEELRADSLEFSPGDTVRVLYLVREGAKERIQVFEGVVLQRRGGGPGATFTVRKMSSGVGVERIFPLESPSVTKLEIKARGHVRRARLFYLRNLTGKKARLRSKVRDVSSLNVVEEEPVAEAPEAAAEAGEAASDAGEGEEKS